MIDYTVFDPNYSGSLLVLSNGNLTIATNAPNDDAWHAQMVRATEGKTSGKWYFEASINKVNNPDFLFGSINVGIASYAYAGFNLNALGVGGVGRWDASVGAAARTGLAASSKGQWFGSNVGDGFDAAAGGTATTPTGIWATSDRIDIAVDIDARLMWARQNGGHWNNSGTANPVTGTGGQPFEGSFSGNSETLGPRVWPSVSLGWYQDQVTVNFGATAFVGTPPFGFTGWTSTYSYVDNMQYNVTAGFVSSDILWVGDFTPETNITVSGFLVNMLATLVGATQATGVIYDSDGAGSAPHTLIASSTVLASAVTTPGFTLTFAEAVPLSGNHRYYVGYITNGAPLTAAASVVTTLGYFNGSGSPTPGSIPSVFPTPTATSGNHAPAMEILAPIMAEIIVTTLPVPSAIIPEQLCGWRAQVGINWLGLALVGDKYTGIVGQSDFGSFTEYGNPMQLLVTSPPIQQDRLRVFIRKFEVDVQTAVATAAVPNPILNLDYSKDSGMTFGPLLIPRFFGKTGEYAARLRWLSLGSSRAWVLRLTCSDPVRRAIIGCYIDAKPGTG